MVVLLVLKILLSIKFIMFVFLNPAQSKIRKTATEY